MTSPFNQREENTFQELDEPFRGRAYKIAIAVKERFKDDPTIKVVIQSGWRNFSDQLKLWVVGRTKLSTGQWVKNKTEPTVTSAKPGQSAHEYHRAVHIVLLDAKTKKWLADDDKRWLVIGECANEFKGDETTPGVTWGGDWERLRDYAHIEDANYKRLAKKLGWSGMPRFERHEGEL